MDKFKNDIQHKFSQREIQPTDEAWGKITGELATSRTNKTKSLWLWSGIAAGFIGLLVLLTPLYFSTSTNKSIVNSEERKPNVIGIERESMALVNQLKSNGIQMIPIAYPKPNSAIEILKFYSNTNLTPTQLKANTLLAEVEQELEKERYSKQNFDEVDTLLAQARTKLSSEKDQQIFDQISAESLLAEVDLEDTNSFKDKIWKLIEVNYNELKSSLGAR
ncbi:hypothetical protein [Psychroflexus montanilacus]|uniref:hypothetical protein n=1 Tax=Psychroflexus montanilacus TaxID=2873598 RepID=UPI001CCB9828|nr:hypothetical protein [Psychroflexus montanilacus]MBZ9650976.1 hypothetical protein [Psychroflexus montanilacus]